MLDTERRLAEKHARLEGAVVQVTHHGYLSLRQDQTMMSKK